MLKGPGENTVGDHSFEQLPWIHLCKIIGHVPLSYLLWHKNAAAHHSCYTELVYDEGNTCTLIETTGMDYWTAGL